MNDYQLVHLREQDIELIRQWRNDQMEILRQKKAITKEEQRDYYTRFILPAFSMDFPSQYLLSFLYRNTCIGYGGLTNVDWEAKRAEVSFLLSTSRTDEKYYSRDFTQFLNLLSQLAFNNLDMQRLFTETFAFRQNHIEILENFGFRKEGVLRKHVYKRGQLMDSILHGFLIDEWRGQHEK
ncbi:MAG: GNAT family N-acetyltransferase [Parachlamydia sp.]|jgi:RimJ/RimL family protein N-acetyltransferase|nr:GNAT family N-acetyltransferase [Parachlamydia sp.]